MNSRLHMRCRYALVLILTILNLSTAQALDNKTPTEGCQSRPGITAICGFVGPEDMELSNDGKTLFVSELPPDFAKPQGQGLMQFDIITQSAKALPITLDWQSGWGDDACQAAPQGGFSTHGIHLSTRKDGKTQLLAVNHNGRDSIEAFELTGKAPNYHATWRGCVTFEGGPLNDVTALANGGFIATVMLDNALVHNTDATALLFSGKKTGYLVEWHSGSRFKRLPGSEAALNNGLQLSADGHYVYFAAFTGKQIQRYDLIQQQITGSVNVSFYPDNLSVQPDGTMIVAGMNDLDAFRRCTLAQGGYCKDLLAFTVATLDPKTLTTTTIYQAQTGLLAAASVAIETAGNLYIGTYTGDRILKIPIDQTSIAAH